MAVNLKPREQCKWEAAALGEIMLRLDPGDGRIRTTRSFQVWEGGGEYNKEVESVMKGKGARVVR
jgi:2-dehydro-3-deoxygluconokinase